MRGLTGPTLIPTPSLRAGAELLSGRQSKCHTEWGLFKGFLVCLFFPFRRFDRIAHTRETMGSDGLNSLSYKVLRTDKYPLYTKITVDIGSPNS